MTGRKIISINVNFLKNPIFWIMLGAVLIRLILLIDMPYTYDEYSSLIRQGMPTFESMIENGIRTDGHPAGLYSFLRVYVSIFGTTPWVLKLPFVLMSIGSVWLTFLIGKTWFSNRAGWLGAAMLGLLAFPVMNGLIARQYTPGLLFCLLSTWCWTKLVFEPSPKAWKWALLLGLSFTGAAYFHYFAALFCVILWLAGWMFVKATHRKYYLVSAGIGILLFLPHVSITMDHLAIGGIPDVLPVPGWDFIVHHFGFISNFSWFIGVPLIFLALAAVLRRFWLSKRSVLALVLFLAPIAIGFIYSNLQSPLLQDRVLLFSFPFFGIWLGSVWKGVDQERFLRYVVGGFILVALFVGFDRESHRYGLMTKGAFEDVLERSLA
ncbi:MAG: hypothetical protein HKN32_01190, partial [Flavobacteriales bacterium]|nr:hypothetical protein [Flavobacteriales bacterium]